MAKETFKVKAYQYCNWSSRSVGKTNLVLRGEDGEICSLRFLEDSEHALPACKREQDGVYTLYYHHNQLRDILDMLRNEPSVFVIYDDDMHLKNSRISNSLEPVYEGVEEFDEHPETV